MTGIRLRLENVPHDAPSASIIPCDVVRVTNNGTQADKGKVLFITRARKALHLTLKSSMKHDRSQAVFTINVSRVSAHKKQRLWCFAAPYENSGERSKCPNFPSTHVSVIRSVAARLLTFRTYKVDADSVLPC
ncbi:hypothetical protein E2C01_057078 [Portunus trituberculatus]|uniref:Uncharacterized protein n=1 Tax=Portunus trituberculatus TaxID=210409 RepID=A0A5B7GZD9_PORTR|nr:hypothetical protein [Portunus trituberculatus]